MSELFSSVKPGDTVHYLTQQGDARKGKVVMNRGTHLVINRGKGQPQVVNDKNYIKHERGGKVVGALLSRVHHVKEAAKMRVPRVTELPSNVPAIKKTPEQQGLIPSPAAMRAKAAYKLGEPQMNAAKAFGWVKEGVNPVSSFVRKVKQRGIGHAISPKNTAFTRVVDKANAEHDHKNQDLTKLGDKIKSAKRFNRLVGVAGNIHRTGKAKFGPVGEEVVKAPVEEESKLFGVVPFKKGDKSVADKVDHAYRKTFHKKRALNAIYRKLDRASAKTAERRKAAAAVDEATWQGAGDPYNWDPVMRAQIFKAAAEKNRTVQKSKGQPVPHELDTGRTLKSKPAPFRRGMKEDSKDAEGAAERVAKTKKHKKKLHEVSNTTLTNYVYKAIQDRKKSQIRARNAHLVHDPDRLGGADGERATAEYKQNKARADKRSAGIKRAVGKIASHLPAEPLKAHSDSEGARHGGWSGMESHEINEVSAPGQESWIKANKQRFIDRYGKEKGLRVLYAKAWKMSKNEDVNEAAGKFTALRRQFTRNENQNRHTKNAHLLATHFGSEEERGKAKDALARLEKHGHSMDMDFVYDMHNKYAHKMYEARENEYTANLQLAKAAKPTQKGHYLMRDGRKLSGPHSPEDAVKAYKGLSAQGTDTKGVKIVHVKETHMFDVTTRLISEAKVKEAAKKAITLTKAKGNKHVDTEPKLDIQDKGTGGPMGGSHEEPEGSVNAKV